MKGIQAEVWSVYSKKECHLPKNSLCFMEMQDFPIRALVEPDKVTDGLYRATPAIYSLNSKIAIINLGPSFTLKEGTKVGEAIPLRIQSAV